MPFFRELTPPLLFASFPFLFLSCPVLPRREITITRGSNKPSPVSKEVDMKRGKNTILSAVTKVEERVQAAVEEVVGTLFHEMPEQKKAVVMEKAKTAVDRGVSKVKKQVDEHDEKEPHLPYENHYPYYWPHRVEEKCKKRQKTDKAATEHIDSRILHAVEAAENAVFHAIEDEVQNLFHELEHHDDAEKEDLLICPSSAAKGEGRGSRHPGDCRWHDGGGHHEATNGRVKLHPTVRVQVLKLVETINHAQANVG